MVVILSLFWFISIIQTTNLQIFSQYPSEEAILLAPIFSYLSVPENG